MLRRAAALGAPRAAPQRGMAAAAAAAAAQPDNYYPHGLVSLSPECPVFHVLDGLGGFSEQALDGPSPFVRPTTLRFTHGGSARRWDAVAAHDSVAVLLLHAPRRAFVIVRQFRPAVYAVRARAARAAGAPDPPPAAGLCYELCAGIMDKAGKSAEQTCCEEVLEEVGYSVPPAALRRVAGGVVSSAGITGATQDVFYAEVDESMRACAGGGTACRSERVEALALPVDAAAAFIEDAALAKTPGLCFGLLWGAARLAGGGGT
ncbi:NUDT14 [Scenedesmus sp. PABB004]|nr:NUDT14 [Scenedesmus sp. PABB004]